MSEHKQVGQASRCKPESQSNSSMAQVWRSIDRMRQAFTAVRTSWASCNADTLHNTEQCHSCHCIFVCLSLSLSLSLSHSLSVCLSVCLSLSVSLSLSRACSLHTDRSAASPLWQCRPPRPGGRSEHFKIHEVPELEPQSCGVHAVATTVDVIA